MKLFNSILILFLLPTIVIANTNKPKGKYTKEKTITKEFNVTSKTTLKLMSDYGNIDISTWDEDKVVIDVLITVSSDDEQEVNEGLKKIQLEYDLNISKEKLSILTTGYYEVKGYKSINFQVKAPKNSPLIVYNGYGNIVIDKTNADIDFAVGYGSVIAKELNGKSRIISSYSNDNSIEYAKDLEISAMFADFNIGTSKNFQINRMQSSNISVDEVASLDFKNCSYGTIKVNSVLSSLQGECEYVVTNIKNIAGKLVTLKTKYGSLDIDNWRSNQINLDTYGTRLVLGYSDNIPFDINLTVKGCIIPTTLSALPKTVQSNLKEHSSKEYSSYHVKKNSGRLINLKIAKGILQFEKITHAITKN